MKLQINNIFRNPKILLAIIILLQLLLLAFFMDNKVSYFCDDIYSYILSNAQIDQLPLSPTYNFNTEKNNKWLSGDSLKKYLTASKNNTFDYSNIYYLQSKDCHPPFYYYLLHTVCSLFPEKFSKWHGFSLNIIFFVFSQLLLFSISNKVFNSEKYALLTCYIYGFSSFAMDCNILIRMYSLLTFFYLLLLNLYIICLEKKISLYTFIGIVSVVMLGSITHHHFNVYAFFLTLVFIIYAFANKEFSIFWHISLSALLGEILALAYFPFMFSHIFNSSRGTEALAFFDRISPSIIAISSIFEEFFPLNHYICIYLTFGAITLLSIIFVNYLLNSFFTNIKHIAFNLMIICIFIYNLIICPTIDYRLGYYQIVRFIMPITPISIIALVAILSKYKKIYLTLLISFLCTISSFFMLDFDYSYYNSKFFTNFELEKLAKNNNLVIHSRLEQELSPFYPIMINANKVYIDSKSIENVTLPKSYPKSGKNYLIFFNYKSPNSLNYKKILDGWLWSWGTRYEVYELPNS